MAAVDATEEALYNLMFMATTVTIDGHTRIDEVIRICDSYSVLNLQRRLSGVPPSP